MSNRQCFTFKLDGTLIPQQDEQVRQILSYARIYSESENINSVKCLALYSRNLRKVCVLIFDEHGVAKLIGTIREDTVREFIRLHIKWTQLKSQFENPDPNYQKTSEEQDSKD